MKENLFLNWVTMDTTKLTFGQEVYVSNGFHGGYALVSEVTSTGVRVIVGPGGIYGSMWFDKNGCEIDDSKDCPSGGPCTLYPDMPPTCWYDRHF